MLPPPVAMDVISKDRKPPGKPNAGLAADVSHRHAIGALLEYKRLLGVRKPRCLHRAPLLPARESMRKTLAKNDPVLRPQSNAHTATTTRRGAPAAVSCIQQRPRPPMHARGQVGLRRKDSITARGASGRNLYQ